MKAIKDTLKNIDLYGFDVLLQQLKNNFSFVSYCSGSTPTAGSLTTSICKVKKFHSQMEIKKSIFHKNGDITLKTNKGFLKFSN